MGGLITENGSQGSLCNIAKGPALNGYIKTVGNALKQLIMKKKQKMLSVFPVIQIKLAVNAIDLHLLFCPE